MLAEPFAEYQAGIRACLSMITWIFNVAIRFVFYYADYLINLSTVGFREALLPCC
jgi:hypothetical protein